MTLAVDLGRKATKQTNKKTLMIIFYNLLVRYDAFLV